MAAITSRDQLADDELATLYFLQAVGDGRDRFALRIDDLVRRCNCSKERLDILLRRLQDAGLIELNVDGDVATVALIETDPATARRWFGGEKLFHIPPAPAGKRRCSGCGALVPAAIWNRRKKCDHS